MLDVGKLKQLVCAAGWLVLSAAALQAQPSVLTWHNDNLRTGQNLQETTLTPSNVKSSSFGLLFKLTVDGKVDAQPLYVPGVTIPNQGVHNVLYVATEHDSVYAFDADTGTLLKQVSLLNGENTSDTRGCSQVTPEIGITATPVIDPNTGSHGTIYVVAMTKDNSSVYHQRIHALDMTTLAEEFNGPVEVAATYPGTGAEKANSGDTFQTFRASQHKERAALLLSNGVVYTAWSSHCDAGPYTGWVIGYNKNTLAQTSVINLTPNGNDGGMWAAGSGPAADSSGNIYVPMGNGTFDTTLSGGFPNKADYGNAFVKLSTSGSLSVADYFTMSNTTSESGSDTDLASGGGMLLPTVKDAQSNNRNLAVVAGKDSNLYVMDQTNLGKFNTSSDTIYQQLSGVLSGGVWASPAWFNGTLYYGPQGNVLKAFTFANGQFSMNPSSQSSKSFTYPGTSPSVSANGTSNGIVWAIENSSPAVLHAYDATNLATELYNSSQAANSRDQFGNGNKFIVPTVVNGRVYAAANGSCSGSNCTGFVGVFGLIGSIGAVSASPNAGSGSSVTLSEVYSDTAGGGDITKVWTFLRSSYASSPTDHACYVLWDKATNLVLLDNDAGNSFGTGKTLGQSGTLSNSQCTVDVGASSVGVSGNNLTLNLALSFTAAFDGAQQIWMYANNASINSGWAQNGTFTVTTQSQPPPPPPVNPGITATSVSPNAGSGSSGTLSEVYTDSAGGGDITKVWTFLRSSYASSPTDHACYVLWDKATNLVLLDNDAGNSFGTGKTLGQSGTLSNSQCTVDVGASSVGVSGNNLTLNLALSFTAGFAGMQQIWMYANNASVNSGWVQTGTFTVTTQSQPPPPPPVNPGITAVSVSPNAGSGSSGTLSEVYTDSAGGGDITKVWTFLRSSYASSPTDHACYVLWDKATNLVLLDNDAGNSFGTGKTLGQSGTLSNSQCSLNVGASSVSVSGNTLTLNLALTFTAGFAGTQQIWMYANNASVNSGWVQNGTFTVTSTPPPVNPGITAVSVSPNGGSASSVTLSEVFTDSSGGSDITKVWTFLRSSYAANPTNHACYVLWDKATNLVLLDNDAGTSFGTGKTLGQSGTLSNSQCTLNVGSSSVSVSGNTLTLNLALTFTAGFAGTQQIWMYANNSTINSGWVQTGTWSVP